MKLRKLTQYIAIAMLFVSSFSAYAGEVKDPFVKSYLSISDSLSSDKAVSAFDLLEFQSKAADAGLTKDKLKKIKEFSAAKDIKSQREAFKSVSQVAIEYAKSKKLDLFKANCPMANADWLQAKEEVRNPYYGSSMLSCGSSEKL